MTEREEKFEEARARQREGDIYARQDLAGYLGARDEDCLAYCIERGLPLDRVCGERLEEFLRDLFFTDRWRHGVNTLRPEVKLGDVVEFWERIYTGDVLGARVYRYQTAHLGPLTVYLSPEHETTYAWDNGQWLNYTGDGTPCSDWPYYSLEGSPPWAPPAPYEESNDEVVGGFQ